MEADGEHLIDNSLSRQPESDPLHHLQRGKWRPRLVTLALSNSASLVRSTTKSASLLPAAEALTKLCTLSGVGPATASAILALFDPSAEPFMSDEAMQGVSGGGKADYTVKAWKAYREQMQVRKKAGGWNGMEELEKAFWSEAVMKRYEGVEKKGAVQVKAPSAPSKGGKRKSVGSVEGGEGAEPRPTGRAERAAKKHKAA